MCSACRDVSEVLDAVPELSPGWGVTWTHGQMGWWRSLQRLRSSIEHGHGRRPGRAASRRAVGKRADLANAVIFEEPLPGGNLSFPSY